MLREYQINPVNQSYEILKAHRIVYLQAEMRLGKSTMCLTLANMLEAKSVLVVTTKKVMKDKTVETDYEREGFKFELKVINFASLHKVKKQYDVVVADEAHSFGKYPIKSLRTKRMQEIVGDAYLILMSGTPHPESISQLYHQFSLSKHSPFKEKNFYQWAGKWVVQGRHKVYEPNYVNVFMKKVSAGQSVADYSKADNEKVLAVCSKYFFTLTQQEAGFKIFDVEETVIEISIDDNIHKLCKYLIKNKMFTFKNGDTLVADTAVKLQNKIHQLCSGTVKTESATYVLDTSKINYIKQNYLNQKIVIFYKYIAEGTALREAFKDEYTELSNEFNFGNKRIFISQIQAGSTGINLSTADIIIFYNIDFSYVQYAQARARSQSFERTTKAQVHWLFAKNGIERKIYDVVQGKKDYNSKYFKKDFYLN